MSKFGGDTRGLAVGILKFIGGFIFFAMLYGVFNLFIPDMFGGLGLAADGQQLSTTQNWFELAWSALPFIVGAMLIMRLLSRSAFESRGGVR
jgi:hypothetical protein